MRRRLTLWAGILCAIAVGLLVPGAGAANQAANLDQCANGSAGSTVCTWQNGDLNNSNSFYREGDSVPFRAVLTNLSPGTHTLVIQYDTEQNGKHAYDYLTRFDRTVTGADPCAGVSPCDGSGTHSPTIPFSDNPTPPNLALVPDSDRYFTIWNGSISDVHLGGATDVPNEQQSVTIAFSASESTVVIAWGGHIANEITWPRGTGAGSIDGSAYHMRLIGLDGQGGNQDRSLKANAVPPAPPTFTTDVETTDQPPSYVGTIPPGGSVTDNAVLGGDNGPVSGSVSFYVCYAASGEPTCTSGGSTAAFKVPLSELGTASSGPFTPDHGSGTYCFRAEYVPDSQAFYSKVTETNTTIESEGNHGECFTFSSGPAPPPSPTPTVATTITLSNGDSAGDAQLVGTIVHDVATVAPVNDRGTPSGTVTFSLFSGTGCQGDPTKETVGLADGSASSSNTTVAAAGLSYLAHYSGDETYGEADGPCENLRGNQPPAPPGKTPTPTSTPAPTSPPPPRIDLAITKAAAPNPATLGQAITWTIVVKNNGPDQATGVTVGDAVPAGTSLVSVATSQGSCKSGAMVECDLGSMPAGKSATVTLVTTAQTTGTLTNTAMVVGKESETNTANNTATATDVVRGVLTPPKVKPPKTKKVVYCTAVNVKPKQLFVGRPTVLTFRVVRHGKHVSRVRVQIRGKKVGVVVGHTKTNQVIVRVPTTNKGVTFTYLKREHRWVVRYTKGHKGIVFTKPSLRNGIVKVRVYPTKAGIVTFVPLVSKVCSKSRIGVTGVFTPPVTG
jgi:uncharacterized repeat protein (TIGR01451 family)